MKFIIHEKKLSVTDFKQKLTVTKDLLKLLVPVARPGSEEEIEVVDEWERRFTFRLRVRPITALGRYYKKAEFQQKEWHAFVVEKGLKKHEVVYFWRDGMNNIRVQVRNRPCMSSRAVGYVPSPL